MASIVNASRLSVRMVARRVAQDATRGFRTSVAPLAAQNFTMPALSPTMTEGNIASWKIKEGESFSAGDVILEIETDKASMDVEAQDDGILMKIVQGDGSKAVQVGARIGVLAEAGDDISTLEMPADEGKSSKPEPKKVEPASSSVSQQQEPQQSGSGKNQVKKSGKKAAPQKYPLYPSVAQLVAENGLDEAAISEMTPTGPQGRLLKGDVLAYLGKISEQRPADIKARFDHNSHLDLSNVKIAAPKETPTAKKVAAPAAEHVPKDLLVSIPISFAKVVEIQARIEKNIGTFLPLSEFITRATEMANDDLPLPSNYKPSADELFNQVLGLNKLSPNSSKGYYMPQVAALPTAGFTGVAPKPRSAKKVDIIDVLSAGSKNKAAPRQAVTGVSGTGINVFSLTVPAGEEKRADAFLQRVKLLLEADPGRLVL